VLQYVKIEGNRLKVIASVNLKIFGMAVSPTNNVILVTNGSKLKQINASGTPEDSKYSIHPLEPISSTMNCQTLWINSEPVERQ
jgi:hypothetical protein